LYGQYQDIQKGKQNIYIWNTRGSSIIYWFW